MNRERSLFDFAGSDSPALVDRTMIASHAELASFCDRLDAALVEAGAHKGTTVASSLDSDIWGAATAVAGIRGWTYAPQNPSLRRIQLRERFDLLGAAALVVTKSSSPRAVEEAQAAGMAVVRLGPKRSGLAEADITVECSVSAPPRPSRPDLAVLLHTSGTTARPLVVPIGRDNLRASLANMSTAFAVVPTDRSLLAMPLFHVHALVASLLLPIANGGSAACPGMYDAPAFLSWLTELSPTYYSAVPTVHQSVLDRIASHPEELGRHRLRFARSSSAPLARRTREGLERALGVPVLDGYAMTETTSQITTNPLPPAQRKDSSVGLSVGPTIQIVDARGVALGPGDPGRVRVKGPTVVSEYLADPATTADRFEDGWLSTGDIGYRDVDGYLFLTGRTSHVIRRGGESVSAADVEASLLEHELVHEALVFAVPDSRLGEQVAAVVVADAGADEAALREHVLRRRAPFEVPRRILLLDSLPTGPLGKPLRAGVAEMFGLRDLDQPDQDRPVVAARNETERALTTLWRDVLATHVPGIHHHFFELGGDSLLVKALLLRVREQWDIEVPFIDFFDALTIADQAALLTRLVESGAGASPADHPAPSSDPAQPFALSRAQERLWIIEQIDAGQANYHIPLQLRMDGVLDVARLERAFTTVIERHEALRTRVLGLVGDTPMQQVRAPTPFRLERGELPADDTSTQAVVAAHFERPFDLASGALIRALLLSDNGEHLLSIVIHHIAADGSSLDILRSELSRAYEQADTNDTAAPLDAQYRDFVGWETQRRSTDDYEYELEEWVRRLGPSAMPLDLPYDRTPDAPPGGPAHSLVIPLNEANTDSLRSLSRQTVATPFMVLLSAFAAALSELTGSAAVTVATPSEDRVWPPSTPLIGYFVNTLPLRIDCGGAPTFRELTRRVRGVALDAYKGGEVSFDDIVERVNPPRNITHTPLYDVMFTAVAGPGPIPSFGGATIKTRAGSAQRIKSHLELDMRVLDREIVGSLTYDTRWFDEQTALTMASLIGEWMDRGISAPDAAWRRP